MIALCGAWVWQELFVDHNDLPTVRTSNWMEQEFAQVHGRIASRLKAAVHVHISAADAREDRKREMTREAPAPLPAKR